MATKLTSALPPAAFLIVFGEVETAPGRFAPGIVSSVGCESVEAAEERWLRLVRIGIYEEPFETHEVRDNAPALNEVLGAYR